MDAIGAGFVLVRRDCFEALLKSVNRYRNAYVGRDVHGFFEEIRLPDGRRLGEDFSFCQRWRAAGGTVYADIGAKISHIGDFHFSASFIQKLRMATSKAP